MGSGAPRPRSIAPPPPQFGELVAGKYRVERVIGEGGMGTVLAAKHELLDAAVAIKLLSPDLVRHKVVTERFLNEARAAARLKSDHVARVTDVGVIESGQPYIVMELLDGEDLDQRVQRLGKLPIAQAVDFMLQACEAMAHAHAAAIVHRDLKPGNLFVATTPDGREVVKVLDFGVAKLVDSSQRPRGDRSGVLTGEHVPLGSPSYMSPEQVRDSRNIDKRTDLWSLGTILYELVTGTAAFAGESVGDIFGRVLHGQVTPLKALRPDAPGGLEAVIAKCLERSVDRRFADSAELAAALAPFGSGACAGLVERISTIARTGRTTNPSAPRSTSQPGIEDGDRVSAIPPSSAMARVGTRGATPASEVSALAASLDATVAKNADTLAPPPQSGARWPFAVGLAGAALTAAGVFLLLRPHVLDAPRAPAASAAAVALPVVASAPAAPLSTVVSAIAPATAGSVSPSAASASVASGSPSAPAARPTKRGAPAPAIPPKTAGKAHLPGVLDSPD